MSKGKKKDQDLTRIENLSEYIHEDDTAVDRLFESFNSPGKSSSSEDSETTSDEEGSRLYNLDELEDSPETESEYSEPIESETEYVSEVESTDFSSPEESSEESTEGFAEQSFDEPSDFSDYQSSEEDDSFEESSWETGTSEDDQLPPPIPEEVNKTFFIPFIYRIFY